MSENQHHHEAVKVLDFLETSEGIYVDPTTQALTTAQAEATLALAYEQRTANLIAWVAGGQPTPELREMIAKRMGLA